MWHTPDGDGKLAGAEARLVEETALLMAGLLMDREPDEPFLSGARAFDRLDPDRQAYLVLDVARRLTDDSPPIKLEAWNEAVVHAIFLWVEDEVDEEVRFGSGEFRWRTFVRDAYLARLPEKDLPPKARSKKLAEWRRCLAGIERRILRGRDFLDEDVYDVRESLPDYFTSLPPDLTEASARDLEDYALELDRRLGYATCDCPLHRRKASP